MSFPAKFYIVLHYEWVGDWIYGISTFVGYLMSNTFLFK